MSDANLDKIGHWSEIKLDIVRAYYAAYTKILSKSLIRRFVYVDAFAGAGHHISKQTREVVQGSPSIALALDPGFDEYHFIDLDRSRTKRLQSLSAGRSNVFVYNEDCNSVLLDRVFPRCRFADFARGLCLLDPYRIDVNWQVFEAAGQSDSIEIFHNFMVMDANMNMLLKNPEKAKPDQVARFTAMWGDETWREEAYVKSRSLFGDMEEKAPNKQIAKAWQKRLREVAGFKYVPDPLPMKNSTGAVVYYLYFASSKRTGAKIVEDIFRKYRN